MNAKTSSKMKKTECWFEISDPIRLAKEPTVSVLMLAYNHGHYLADAIEGVLNQKIKFEIELLIGEDFSTDNTREIAIHYQRLNPNIIRIITSDINVGANRNLLRILDASRGEILAWCEGDDYWIDRHKLTKQIDAFNRHQNIDLSFHSSYLRNFDSKKLNGPHYIVREMDQIIPIEEVISGDGSFMPSASLLIRKSAINRIPIGMLESAPICDYIFQVYGSLNGGAYYINTPMCVYRRGHPESWSVSIRDTEKLIKFETAFAELINKMNNDLGSHRSSFTELIYHHYFPRFMAASISDNKLLKSIFFRILLPHMGDFNLIQKTNINWSRIGLFSLMISKSLNGIRRVKAIKKFITKYSTNRIRYCK